MKYIIEGDVMESQDLDLKTLGFLLFLAGGGTKEELEEMVKKAWSEGWVTKESASKYIFNIASFKDLRLCIRKENSITERCLKLAEKLRPLFPKGYKIVVDTKVSWRGSQREVALRLATFFKRYGTSWKDEDIVNATQKYISMFENDSTYMRVLKYFIYKDERKVNGFGEGFVEEKSPLAEILENPDAAAKEYDFAKLR